VVLNWDDGKKMIEKKTMIDDRNDRKW